MASPPPCLPPCIPRFLRAMAQVRGPASSGGPIPDESCAEILDAVRDVHCVVKKKGQDRVLVEMFYAPAGLEAEMPGARLLAWMAGEHMQLVSVRIFVEPGRLSTPRDVAEFARVYHTRGGELGPLPGLRPAIARFFGADKRIAGHDHIY